MPIYYYIIVGVVVILFLVLRIKGKARICGPVCPFPKNPTQTKKTETYPERLEKIRKKIEQVRKQEKSASETKEGQN